MSAHVTRRDFLATAGLAASACALPRAFGAGSEQRPNILVIMADDMGYSDIGCFGGEIHTPNLDALAAGGLRMTQFYNTARCCPSRASLLSGLYSHQTGVGWMAADWDKPGYRGYLSDRCVTIAEVLRPAGYTTLMAGKWHVGEERPHWPVDRGFDEYYGLVSGGSNYWRLDPGRVFARNDQALVPDAPGFYLTDAFTDNALSFLDKYGGKQKPFFLYLAYTSPHWPLHAWPEDIQKYRGQYLIGWDELRRRRYQRMIEMGIVKKEWPLSPRDSVAPAWETLSEEKKRDMDLRMAIYAAQVDRMDQNIGRVVRKLRQLGQLDNTLILFLSDNGGCAEGGAFGFDRATGPLGTAESYSSYGLAWANASNTPFRRFKHWVHEGGISTPLIAHWPAVIKACGETTDQPGHIIDLMATCVDVAGAHYPRERDGKQIVPLEGESLAPILREGQRKGHDALYWEHEGNRAVRQGDWKLVSRFPRHWELYNLRQDRTEQHDLAQAQPARVKEMVAMYVAWARRSQVLPWPVRRPPSSDKREFVLKAGDQLEGKEVPNIADTAFTVSAVVEATGDGVIVAQGGSQVGFSLLVEDGKPAFAVRSWEATTTIRADQSILGKRAVLRAQLDQEGAMTLWIDQTKAAAGAAPILIHTVPGEGLSVGRDAGNPVGAYAAPSPFHGTIHELRLTLER